MNLTSQRIRPINDFPVGDGRYVLYWMIGTRRVETNFALDRAVEWCEQLRLPLLIFEPLSCRFEWSAIRFHQFVLDGMVDNQAECLRAGITYFPFISPKPDADRGLLHVMSEEAAVVVTDDSLVGSLPSIVELASRHVSVLCEAVDSSGVVPFRSANRPFHTAASFRRYLQREIPDQISWSPSLDALRRGAVFGRAPLPPHIRDHFPSIPLDRKALRAIPLETSMPPDPRCGGRRAGLKRLREFLSSGVANYGVRGDLRDDTHSRLSPYFHFGHIGPHDVVSEVSSATGWLPPMIWPGANGARHGWWGLPKSIESFLDEVITWREVSLNGAAWIPSFTAYESLPDWALRTLRDHAKDVRPWLYDLEVLETGQTHDPLWNAAQNQLVQEGLIHSYVRMLWGKKILEWSPSPREALQRMIYLNDAYATDGRDPNSYSGIFWVMGRYDHPWVERPIFGQVRYMTSDNTAKKFKTSGYVERYAPEFRCP